MCFMTVLSRNLASISITHYMYMHFSCCCCCCLSKLCLRDWSLIAGDLSSEPTPEIKKACLQTTRASPRGFVNKVDKSRANGINPLLTTTCQTGCQAPRIGFVPFGCDKKISSPFGDPEKQTLAAVFQNLSLFLEPTSYIWSWSSRGTHRIPASEARGQYQR